MPVPEYYITSFSKRKEISGVEIESKDLDEILNDRYLILLLFLFSRNLYVSMYESQFSGILYELCSRFPPKIRYLREIIVHVSHVALALTGSLSLEHYVGF